MAASSPVFPVHLQTYPLLSLDPKYIVSDLLQKMMMIQKLLNDAVTAPKVIYCRISYDDRKWRVVKDLERDSRRLF
jgi:hypothetical protein